MIERAIRAILVIDNDKPYLDSVTLLLRGEGYTVFSAESLEEAAQHLAKRYIDLILIDNRLEDNGNPYDNSGADFVGNADPSQAIVLMSYYLHDGIRLQRVSHNVRAFSKTRPAIELLELVEEILQTLIPYNQELKIYWSRTSAKKVVERLEQNEKSVPLDSLIKELEEVLRKLFWIESKIFVHAIEQGRGGSAVLKVFSTVNRSVQRPPIIVKFGWRENIDNELLNYRVYVQPYFYMRTTQMLGQPAYTHHLAGFKQMFVGYEQYWRPQLNGHQSTDLISFATAFNRCLLGELHFIIKTLFLETYSVWFADRQTLTQKKNQARAYFKDTVETYEELLSLQGAKKQALIRQNIDSLRTHTFKNVQLHIQEERVTFITKDFTEELPNPVHFWQHYQHCIPDTTIICLTHGDLNPHNIFVNRTLDSWLIDFQRTGWGPILRDSAELESAIKFSLLTTKNLARLLKFERAILQMPELASWSKIGGRTSAKITKAEICVRAIRQEMAKVSETSIMEYHASLFFHALKMLSFNVASESMVSELLPSRRPVYHAHLLYSAAKIADILMKHSEGAHV